jgi:hypothetical protein
LFQRLKEENHAVIILCSYHDLGLVNIFDDGKSFKRFKQEIIIFNERTKVGFDCQDHIIIGNRINK